MLDTIKFNDLASYSGTS